MFDFATPICIPRGVTWPENDPKRNAMAKTTLLRVPFSMCADTPLFARTPIIPLMASTRLRLHKEAACGGDWRDFVKPQAVRLLRQEQRACMAEAHQRMFTMECVSFRRHSDQLAADSRKMVRIERLPFLGETDQQRQVAQAIDPPGNAVRQFVERGERIGLDD
jgi:hypothetical protein